MNSPINPQWQQAVRETDVALMQKLLQQDPTLIRQGIVLTRGNGTTYEKSPLRMVNHSLEAAQLLVDAGADPNWGADAGMAILKASPEVAAFLLDVGADVNRIGNEEGTALMFEVAMNNADLVQLYLDRGADVNYQSKTDGTSALHIATEKALPQIVELLLKGGADPTLKNRDGQTALEIAKTVDASEVVSMLEKV